MNRYQIVTDHGVMKMYYKNIEEAKRNYPGAEISLYEDKSHLDYIQKIKDSAEFVGYDYRNRECYKVVFGIGTVLMKFSIEDSEYLDFCMYQISPIGRTIQPVTWTLSTPEYVWNIFFSAKPKYTEVASCCKSRGQKIQRPKELKGVKQVCSVAFCKAKCPVYIVGNDIYIDHHDYFSPSLRVTDEDIGTPLSYRANKYLGKEVKKKFVYDDSWGDIVLRNVAWLKFENIIPWFKHCNDLEIAIWMRNQVFYNLGFNTTEGGYMDWLRFFENVCIEVKKYLKINQLKG